MTANEPAGPPAQRRSTDFKALYRQLEATLAQIARIDNVSKMLEVSLESLLERFEDQLGFEGGRIYRREGEDFYLCCGFGSSRDAPIGLRVPRDYQPHVRTLAEGLLIMRRGEPGFDPEFEAAIGVAATFAAIAVGDGNTHVIAFSIKGDVKEEQLLYSLTAVRHVINLKLQQLRASDIIEQSRIIHEIILPSSPPRFPGYDIDGRSRPAEIVGGDLFDYLPLPAGRLGVAIGDSTGHGLPAALLARDVITGLRMAAISEPPAITATLERLNQLVNRAGLASRFVSLFYGVLDPGGELVYSNAGHNPPLLRRNGSFRELDRGGTVLGAIPGASYASAGVRLAPGDLLVMYTDGVTEQEDPAAEPYGVERLQALLLGLGAASATEVVAAIFAAVEVHRQGAPVRDDLTVVAVRRTGPA